MIKVPGHQLTASVKASCISRIVTMFCLVCLHHNLQAQGQINFDTCKQKDLCDLLRQWRHKPEKKVAEDKSLLVIPSGGYNPTNGFFVGAASQYVFKGKQPTSPYSYLQSTLFVTTKKQLLFQARNNVYTHHDKIFLTGDWRFLIFSQPTYGLSTSSPRNEELHRSYNWSIHNMSDDSLVQPMVFNYVRFYQTISWRVKNTPVFLGVGYHLDYYYNIQDENLDTSKNMYTSHYLYSKNYGFNPKKYMLSGISLNLTGDTRDNQVNATKGYYYNVNWRVYPTFLGSAANATQLNLEWRSFYNIFPRDKRKVLAFWLMGNFSSAGKMPYLALPALGYDQRGKSGRGYTQGRFRGPNMVYGEMEYRFPISGCGGILGGVAFINAATADNPSKSVALFGDIAPAGGLGLRIMVDKVSRSNLQIDVGVGRKSAGVYIGIGETF